MLVAAAAAAVLCFDNFAASNGARLHVASSSTAASSRRLPERDLPCATSAAAAPPPLDDVAWQELPDDSEDTAGGGVNNGALHLRAVFGGRALRPLPWASVRECLRGRRIAIVGDSLTRYQYLNLVHFIAYGSWYSARPHLENERQWGSWATFFRGSTARLNKAPNVFEVCDCVADPPELRIENRYFADLEGNISIAFRQMRGTLAQRGHNLDWLNAECRTPPCVQSGCVPGECSGFNYTLTPPRELLEHFASDYRPDTIIVNSGFWGGFNAPQTLSDLAAVAVRVRILGVRDLIWKVTTAWMSPEDPSQPGRSEQDQLIPALRRAEAGAAPWRIYDALALTLPLVEALKAGAVAENVSFWDKFHFQQDVYRGLNEALLLDLMRGCSACCGLEMSRVRVMY